MSRDKLGETEEAWFDDEFGGTPSHSHARGAMTRGVDVRTRTQLLVLASLVVLTFVAGLALGAFSGHASPEPVAPAPKKAEPTAPQRAALETAEQWAGTKLLADDALLLALGDLLAERRADVAPLPTEAPATPTEDPESDPAEDGGHAVADAAPSPTERRAPRPVARAPREKPPVPREPKERVPTEKTPTEKAPTEKTPIEKAPTEKAPTEPVPTEKAPPAPVSADAKERAAAAIADGKAKSRGGDWKGAVAAYSTALAASPGNAKALAGRGRAYFELKKTDLAKRDLEAVLAQNPTHATALLTLGSIAQDQGKKAVARGYYERYLRRYPNGRRAAEVRGVLGEL